MSPRNTLLFIIILFCLGSGGYTSYAQTANKDSLARVRQEAETKRRADQLKRDSINAARQAEIEARQEALWHKLDSTRTARARIADSIREIRERRADSLAAIREYRESKYYKDSVKWAREDKIRILQEARKRVTDSMKASRKRIFDSTTAVRKARTDSIKYVQKRRTDSMTAIRKYKESKRFADSVAVVKKLKLDSMQKKRKLFTDSMAKHRKKVTDSLARLRKAKTDSLVKVRKLRTDSLTTVRKVKTDSLAKVSEKKEKVKKTKEKEREQKQQLAFELKIKKKHQAYSNEKMLKKRWGPVRRLMHNTTTRYNYYFNADRKMDEALLNMQRAKKDNYDSLLVLYPFNPDRDSALLSADMDSIIQKTSLGIQIHDPRTKWGDDLYILLGQAYFYKGNYTEAAAAFRYALSLRDKRKRKDYSEKTEKQPLSIAQADKKTMLDFIKHRSVHNEALLWLAHTFTQMKQQGNAESVLDLVDSDPNFPKEMRGRLALEKAFIALSQNDHKYAAEQLTIVAKDNNIPDWLRMRAAFITGQIYNNRGEYAASVKSYEQVLDLHPKIEMDFYARKNLAYSTMFAGGNQEDAVATLKKVLNDGKYQPYYEQVYYVLGRLSANAGKNIDAISYLNQGIKSAKVTPKQKALSYATLGGIYYKQGQYADAKSAYDSAALLATSAAKDSMLDLAVKRSAALKGVTGPMKTIHDQDSLLVLASLSQKDQLAAVRKYIRKLEQARADSTFKSENAGTNATTSGTGRGGNSTSPYANFYFSNPALVQQGINEFKRKWGNRPQADNWRRMAAISAQGSNNNNQNNTDTDEGDDVELDANGLPTEESLLALIPNTQERKGESLALIQKSYMELANAYIKELEDYPPGIRTLDTFDKRFPDTEYEAEVLYLRYLAFIKQNKFKEAQVYAQQLLQKHPDNEFAKLVKPQDDTEANVNVNAGITAYYDETYDLLIRRQYPSVLARTQLAKQKFTDINYRKRFVIVEAIAFAGIDSFAYADSIARAFIAAYPLDSLRPWADALLKYVEKFAPPKPATANAAGSAPVNNPIVSGDVPPADTTMKLGEKTDPLPLPGSDNKLPVEPYVYKPDIEHYVLFTFAAMEPRAAAVRGNIEVFNKAKFAALNLSSEIMIMKQDEGLVVTKAFANVTEARIYMNSLRATTQIFKDYKGSEYRLAMISADNYKKLLNNKNTKAYLDFFNSSYK